MKKLILNEEIPLMGDEIEIYGDIPQIQDNELDDEDTAPEEVTIPSKDNANAEDTIEQYCQKMSELLKCIRDKDGTVK
jgi:hypothetical protein